LSERITFTVSFVRAYEFQELIMGMGQWTPPPQHEVVITKEMIE